MNLICSFCEKPQDRVRLMLARGPEVKGVPVETPGMPTICDHCLLTGLEILVNARSKIVPFHPKPTTAGEIRDLVIDFCSEIDRLDGSGRKALLGDLLDHRCLGCGAELPKFGPCNDCGLVRPNEVEGDPGEKIRSSI